MPFTAKPIGGITVHRITQEGNLFSVSEYMTNQNNIIALNSAKPCQDIWQETKRFWISLATNLKASLLIIQMKAFNEQILMVPLSYYKREVIFLSQYILIHAPNCLCWYWRGRLFSHGPNLEVERSILNISNWWWSCRRTLRFGLQLNSLQIYKIHK